MIAIQLVVFDMAGTTVQDDDNVAQSLQSALKHFGYQAGIDDINLVMGYPKPVAIRMVLEKLGYLQEASSPETVDQIHEHFVAGMVSFYENSQTICEKPNAEKVFETLRNNGIKVAIDTGFSRIIADTIFKRLGWQQGVHFDASVTSDEVANGRPYPDLIYKAMELCNITDHSQVAKVGDTASDLQEGTAAGCGLVIGVTTGAYSREDLAAEKHTHLIGDLEELFALIGIETTEKVDLVQ